MENFQIVCVCVFLVFFINIDFNNPQILFLYQGVSMLESIEHQLWVHSYFTTIVQHVLLILLACLVGWDFRIHRLHLCRGVRPPPNEWPEYDTKQSDRFQWCWGFWGMQSTLLLLLLPGPLWLRMVAPDRVLKLHTYTKLSCWD